jgi:hypothetical protein
MNQSRTIASIEASEAPEARLKIAVAASRAARIASTIRARPERSPSYLANDLLCETVAAPPAAA